MSIDVKWLHHYKSPQSKGFYSKFTDNRYGQVYETRTHKNGTKADTISNEDGKTIGYYSHRDDNVKYDYISMIEPYINNNTISSELINDRIATRFGTNIGGKVRLISMRIYDKTYCDYDSDQDLTSEQLDELIANPQNINWWSMIRDGFDENFKFETDEGNVFDKNADKKNIIAYYCTSSCKCNEGKAGK